MERNICNSTAHYESDSKKSKSNLFPISVFILAMIMYAFIATKFLIVETPHADKEPTVSGNTMSVTSKRYF